VGLAVATRLVGVVGILVIAVMMTVGFGDFGGVVQRLFVARLCGAPVVPACRRWQVSPVARRRQPTGVGSNRSAMFASPQYSTIRPSSRRNTSMPVRVTVRPLGAAPNSSPT
jgi:hypothetical protein